MFAGWVFPFAAAPAEDWAEMVREVAPPAPVFMTIFGAAAGTVTGLGAGASNTGLSTGAGSAFFAGGGGAGLTGALCVAATDFFVGTGFFLAGAAFLEGAGFFLETGFLADAFLGAGFLAMAVVGSDLFQFPRG